MSLKKFWKPLGGIVVVYAVLNLILASGLISNINAGVNDIKDNLNADSSQHVNKFANALSGFSALITGANTASGSPTMQIVLLVLESLVIIWALRQLMAGEPISIKQAYYYSMAPLVPFLLVGLVLVVQLLPLTIGTALLALVLSSAVTSATIVNVVFALFFAGLMGWTIYMISGSIFALYIVTLPDMQPRKALRSAKNLVRFRRWGLIRRMLFLPLFIVLVMGIIIVPLILVANFLVAGVFFALLMLSILYSHAYLYNLYRKMIA